jgi:hypothetical protein
MPEEAIENIQAGLGLQAFRLIEFHANQAQTGPLTIHEPPLALPPGVVDVPRVQFCHEASKLLPGLFIEHEPPPSAFGVAPTVFTMAKAWKMPSRRRLSVRIARGGRCPPCVL